MNSYSGILKENKVFLFIGVIIAVLCFMPVIFDVITQRPPVFYGMDNIADNVPDEWRLASMESIKGNEICQTFICSLENVAEIVLYEAEGVNPGDGDIHVLLFDDEADVLIDEWEVKQSDITENGEFSVAVKTPLKYGSLNGKRCRIVIKGTVALKYLPEERYGKGKLTTDGAATSGELVMNIVGSEAPANLLISKCFLCFYLTLLFEWTAYRLFLRRKRPKVSESTQ